MLYIFLNHHFLKKIREYPPDQLVTNGTVSPGARAFGSMFYVHGSIVLFGGETISKLANDIWVYAYETPDGETGSHNWHYVYGSNDDISVPSSSPPILKNPPAGRLVIYIFHGYFLWLCFD